VSWKCINWIIDQYYIINIFVYIIFFFWISGDGRWRNVIRRCGSVSDTGVTGVCNWGVEWNGVYWEECYCSEDNCNSSTNITPLSVITTTLCSLITMYILRNWSIFIFNLVTNSVQTLRVLITKFFYTFYNSLIYYF